jgi:hypothetical protein
LVRNKGETVLEHYDIPCIDWNTGYPLTDAAWCGGPYQLVQNYVPPTDDVPETYEIVEPEPAPEPEPVVEEETVVINGVTYTKAQLREMLGE